MIMLVDKIISYYKKDKESILNMIIGFFGFTIIGYMKNEWEGVYITASAALISFIIPMLIAITFNRIFHKKLFTKYYFLYLLILVVWSISTYYLFNINTVYIYYIGGICFTILIYIVTYLS